MSERRYTGEDGLEAFGERLREAPPLPPLPAGLRERTLLAAAAAAASERGLESAPPAAGRKPWWRRALDATRDSAALSSRGVLVAGAGLAAVAAAALVAVNLAAPDGQLELDGELLGGGGRQALIEVRDVGDGRTIKLSSETLPILPKGEYYEVWFVGPGDSPESPNRVSAGTFHPDPDGVTDTTLFGAVDPHVLPRVEITAEAADGDPAPSSDVVVSRNYKNLDHKPSTLETR